MEARQRALTAALDAMMEWLESGVGQVAIFDATNSTVSRRQFLVRNLWYTVVSLAWANAPVMTI